MLDFKNNYCLKKYNTFGIIAQSAYFLEINSSEEIPELLQSEQFRHHSRLIIGGGSNLLFTKDFDGLVIYPTFDQIEIVSETSREIIIKVGSGVTWDEFVEYAVNNQWGGSENLSFIPGKVGAAAVQNIGAYGVEAKDIIENVEGFNLLNGKACTFLTADCHFGYRSSVFKTSFKNDFLITHLTFRLQKSPHYLNLQYGALEEKVSQSGSHNISTVRKIVGQIRHSKLPDVKKVGNAGSFFKNPVVPESVANQLKQKFKTIPEYAGKEGSTKLSAAWLIDQAGCKGVKKGRAGSYPEQPLVLINLGNAKGKEILHLAGYIQKKVFEKFSIQLQPEVVII